MVFPYVLVGVWVRVCPLVFLSLFCLLCLLFSLLFSWLACRNRRPAPALSTTDDTLPLPPPHPKDPISLVGFALLGKKRLRSPQRRNCRLSFCSISSSFFSSSSSSSFSSSSCVLFCGFFFSCQIFVFPELCWTLTSFRLTGHHTHAPDKGNAILSFTPFFRVPSCRLLVVFSFVLRSSCLYRGHFGSFG